jgi:F-box-like
MDSLPTDILLIIFTYIPTAKILLNLKQVCNKFNTVIDDNPCLFWYKNDIKLRAIRDPDNTRYKFVIDIFQKHFIEIGYGNRHRMCIYN